MTRLGSCDSSLVKAQLVFWRDQRQCPCATHTVISANAPMRHTATHTLAICVTCVRYLRARGRILRLARGRILRLARGRILRRARGRILRRARGRILRLARGRILRLARGRLLRLLRGRMCANPEACTCANPEACTCARMCKIQAPTCFVQVL
jgi:hypothetical protein